jgi:hypothetical protein
MTGVKQTLQLSKPKIYELMYSRSLIEKMMLAQVLEAPGQRS